MRKSRCWADLLPGTSEGTRDYYKYLALASFLAGAERVGGVLFGAIADRIGRGGTMVITILMYSLFTLPDGVLAELVARRRPAVLCGLRHGWRMGRG